MRSSVRAAIARVVESDGLGFVVTNALPRRQAGRFMRWFSRVEHPLVRDLSMAVWQAFGGDLRLDEARTRDFRSVHECFVRDLKPDARPIDHDPGLLVSPCDGIVMAGGPIESTTLVQAKGLTYTLDELLLDRALVDRHRDGRFVTLRLTSTMYHHFHAPAAGSVTRVTLVPGDRWNVNPSTVARVRRVYCRNTRAILPLVLDSGLHVTLVAVGAILVSSVYFRFLSEGLDDSVSEVKDLPCAATFARGEDLGHFRHGSTIVMLVERDVSLSEHVGPGVTVRVGQPLWRLPPSHASVPRDTTR